MKKKQSESEILAESMAIVENSINEELIRTTMEGFGYDLAQFHEAQTQIALVESLQSESQRRKGEQVGSGEAFKVALAELTELHRRHRKAAKLVFEFQPEIVMSLGLTGKLSQSYLPFMASAELFYERLSAEKSLVDSLVPMQITVQIVEKMKAKLFQVKELKRVHLQRQAESEKATLAKNSAFDSLKKWVARYMKVVRLAAATTGNTGIVWMLGQK